MFQLPWLVRCRLMEPASVKKTPKPVKSPSPIPTWYELLVLTTNLDTK